MATIMITLKLENKFLEEVDSIVINEGYQNRTEFIRNALREKIEELKIRKAMLKLASLKGSSTKKITEENYKKARSKAFDKISKNFI